MASERREGLYTHVSVGLLLEGPSGSYGSESLVLITKKKSGLVGLIAGKLELHEDGPKCILREADEEANFQPEDIIFNSEPANPQIIITPYDNKTSIGLIYHANLAIQIPKDGYVPISTEVSFVKLYSVDELLQLIQKPEIWFRPEYNLEQVKQWLRSYVAFKYAVWEGKAVEQEILKAWGLAD